MPPPLRCTSSVSACCSRQLLKPTQSSRPFSTTSRDEQRITRARRQMFQWLATKGAPLRDPLPGSTNYLGAYDSTGQLRRVREGLMERQAQREAAVKRAEASGRPPPEEDPKAKDVLPPEGTRDLMPFPQNTRFLSQAVLSPEFREVIWKRIMLEGKTVKEVSAELGVEMSRVGAVVRLMEVEKEWRRIGKPLATPYANAVMQMLPKTPYPLPEGRPFHESINDLPVHAYTGQQIFHPTSESRQFTRADAAKVFHNSLLPADARIPHPELIEKFKESQLNLSPHERAAREKQKQEMENKKREYAAKRAAKAEAAVTKVDTGRYQFRFTDINVESAGKDGRGKHGVGWRYGAPHMDRSRGDVKIPTSVE